MKKVWVSLIKTSQTTQTAKAKVHLLGSVANLVNFTPSISMGSWSSSCKVLGKLMKTFFLYLYVPKPKHTQLYSIYIIVISLSLVSFGHIIPSEFH